ncbi:hypothetical protein J4406_02490 [Candidatus Woesearchaeota archaeon]|nr:hypothetical protein [Candidatus Woesearchaeota archaeon]
MYKKTVKRGDKEYDFDYYIYIDYSENLVGYTIIHKDKIKEILPKISRFRHYRESKKRKVYLKHIYDAIKKENIFSYFLKYKLKRIHESIEVYSDVLDFIKTHHYCIIFISVDDKQYIKFKKLVNIIDDKKTRVVKESELKRGTTEYQLSLVIDNFLNIKRRQLKK